MNSGADDRIASPMLKHPPLQNATVDRHTPSALAQYFEPAVSPVQTRTFTIIKNRPKWDAFL